MTLPVLVINRDTDRDRWTASLAAAKAQGVDPIRISAIDAHAADFDAADFSALVGPVFWGRDTIKPGALGCFLSHRKAWRHIADAGWPAALVLEDDADLTEPPERAGAALRTAPCDLLFANDRMAGWVSAADVPGEVVLLDHLIAALVRRGGPKATGVRRTPGGDAYLLTAAGARRLLSITEQTRIACGVDWAMVWAALPRGLAVAGIEELEVLDATVARPHLPITARALARPVARLRKGPSVLKHSVEVPIRELLNGGWGDLRPD